MTVATAISKKCNDVSFPKACLKEVELSIDLQSFRFACGEILPTMQGVAAFIGGISGVFELQIMVMSDYTSGTGMWTTFFVSEYFIAIDGAISIGPIDIDSIVNGLYAIRVYNSLMGITSNILTNIEMPNCA